MFDYQLPDGMVVDCIYTDPAENNARDSKPPLLCWAVDKIWEATGDKDFLAEMYPSCCRTTNGGLRSATTTAAECVSMVRSTALWRRPHGEKRHGQCHPF